MAQWLTRGLAIVLLGVAVAAGRLGADNQLENIAPALVVGAAWPLLVLASVVLGAVWRWGDPWDAAARPLTSAEDKAAGNVWPAAFVALAWVWYLSAYTDTLAPRSVGLALAVYTVFTLAGCLAVGRARWLSAAEPFGILFSWLALLPKRRLSGWNPPRGAEALLGVFAGGVVFGAARRSELWGDRNVAEHAELLAAAGVAASSAAAAVLLLALAAWARPRAGATVARAVVPAVASIVVAVAMDLNRLTTSLQILPALLGDPFGEGWDLFGRPLDRLDPAPLGVRGLLWAQLAVLLAGHLTGAIVLARGAAPRARRPAALALAVLVGAAVIAIASH